MVIKKGDFIELEYTGRLKEDSTVFDTTDEKIAKDANIFSEKAQYKPIVICVGEHHILPGIDDFVEGKETGEYKVELSSENAFGKKKAELLQMIPMRMFSEQNIKPVPGLQLNIDNTMGVVKTVSGGRVVVDFNHPLAGKDVTYELSIKRKVDDKKAQVESVLHVLLGLKEPEVSIEGDKAKVKLPQLPSQILDELRKKIESLVKDVKVEFVSPKPESSEAPPEPKKAKAEVPGKQSQRVEKPEESAEK